MNIRTLAVAGLVAAASWTAAPAASTAAEDIKLSGCLVRGQSGGFLLTNGSNEPAWQKTDQPVAPGAVGTTGSVATIFYWLRDDDDLRPHVGHRVEVEGELEREVADGEIKIDRKENSTEVEVKAGGDSLKARLPHTSVVPLGDGDRSVPVVVRKVDVSKVRMVAANCQ